MARKLVITFIFLLGVGGCAFAQKGASLQVSAQVQPSMLLALTSPIGIELSQAGGTEASVLLSLPVGSDSLSFSARVLRANDPRSGGYRLYARLVTEMNGNSWVVDGVKLQTDHDMLLSDQSPYGEAVHHILEIDGPPTARAVSILLTAKAN